MSDHNARVAVVTCTPLAKVTGPLGNTIYDPISPLWHRARMGLSYATNINAAEMCVDGLEVGDARSRVAARCREMKPKPAFLFFLDSDVIVPQDAFTKLFYRLKANPHIDVAAGVYVVKGAAPYDPLIYRENGEGAFWDWAVGDLLTTKQHNIRAVHMGLTLIRVSLFDRMIEAGVVHGDGTDQDDEPFFCTQNYRVDSPAGVATFKGTEDIYFFGKARKIPGECQIMIDTSVLAGHHDKATGITYGLPGDTSPVERAGWLPLPDGSGLRKDRKAADAAGLKLAIDLGAGESRREWPGHVTYRLDPRLCCKPDYCQELPRLNLPDNHYDLVASRHSFEHVGRWEQELLWAECFRICKPGGSLEVIVPSMEWAAAKIVEGEIDTHVLSVLYGAQEQDEEIGRAFNVHYFGYTPKIITALAEHAGFVDVQVQDYHTDPGMGYHMVCKATKPVPKETMKTEPVVTDNSVAEDERNCASDCLTVLATPDSLG